MSKIEYVSNQLLPDDPYTKELVYLLIEEKFRVLYVRKEGKNGGMFWSVPKVSVTQHGIKTYYETFLQDSAFLDKDIKKFLDGRMWEPQKFTETAEIPTPISPVFDDKDLPF